MSSEDPTWSEFLEAAFRSVLESADEGIVVFDRDGVCTMIGRRAGELFGIVPSELVERQRIDVLRGFADACEEPDVFLGSVGANDLLEPPKVVGEFDLRRPMPRTVLWTSIPMMIEGAVVGRLNLVRDITRERAAERTSKQQQARLLDLSPLDPLTGLFNVKRLREELEREHQRSTRAWDSYSVLRIDVDGMKAINNEYGRPVGDDVLEDVGQRLKSCLREYDILARYDADEYAVLLPGADAVAARTVAGRMAKAVADHNFNLADERQITVSVGGALWIPPSGETWDDILRRAGQSVAVARRSGGGAVVVDETGSA